MIFPAHRVFTAARHLDLQIAVGDHDEPHQQVLIPYRHQAQGPDIIAFPCTDREFLDVEARTDDGAILIQLLSEKT